MPGHYFISYSDADGKDFALRLHDALESTADVSCWLDKLDLAGGGKWSSSIPDAIRDCQLVWFVMTRDSVRDNNTCQQELLTALKCKKPIVPLRLHEVDLPFLINTRQWLDFTGDFGMGMARVREHLRWRATPVAALQDLIDRLKDAERDLDRATDPTVRTRIETEIVQLKQDITQQERVVADPEAAARRTAESIERGLEREREPAQPISGKTRTKFINPPPMTAPRYFQDRYEENKIIAGFLRDDACRMLTINGRAGIGKTAMVCRILKSLESGQLPDDLGALAVDGIVYLSAIGTRTINVPNLFADLCQLLPANIARELDALYRDPKTPTTYKMLALLEKFPRGRIIVLLDNFENVVDATECCVADAELDDALRALLNAPHHAVKVMLTTRVAPRDLNLFQAGRQMSLHLDEGLESPFAENVLRESDADGKVGLKRAPDALLNRARVYTRGFPRALEALYATLSADRYTTLEEILSAPPPPNVVEALVGEAFNRLDPSAERVMCALAVYNRPVPPAAVDYLLQPFSASVDSALVLQRLANMQFAHREAGKYYLHPVDREYAFSRVTGDEWRVTRERGGTLWTQRDLLTRGADYFAQTRKPREMWKTIDDLAPQLNEFDLRCAAEDYDTAVSVLLEIDGEYLLLWGHYRLMIEMHERLQGKIQNPNPKSQSLNNLGLAFNSTGQVQKAIACYEQGLQLDREMKNRMWEGTDLGNLGNAYSDLGETRRAIEFYQQALAIAREIGDRRGEGADLGNLGLAYSALGETRRAIEFYQQALANAREIGNRLGEGHRHGNLAVVLIDEKRYSEANEHANESVKIGEEISAPVLCN